MSNKAVTFLLLAKSFMQKEPNSIKEQECDFLYYHLIVQPVKRLRKSLSQILSIHLL